MKLVSLYGSPGTGKSTGAAYIFAKLKMHSINVELITEFAKDKVWEKNDAALSNQAYMFGKQYYRISRCADQVDVIVTDSPLPLGIIYNHDPKLGKSFNDVIMSVYKSYDTIDILLKRVKKYNPIGRLQTEEESDAIFPKIKDMLDTNGIKYVEFNGDVDGYDKIVDMVLKELSINIQDDAEHYDGFSVNTKECFEHCKEQHDFDFCDKCMKCDPNLQAVWMSLRDHDKIDDMINHAHWNKGNLS